MRLLISLYLALLGILVAGSACRHSVPPLSPRATVIAALQDTQFALDADHAAEWLNDADYALATQALTDAIGVAEQATDARSAARAILTDVLTHLPPTTPLRPYFEAVLGVL